MSKIIGQRLYELRKKKNLSLEEMGEILNISGSACSKYERGAGTPSYSNLIKIAEYFDVSLDYLAGRKNLINEEFEKTLETQHNVLKQVERKFLGDPTKMYSLTTSLEETLDKYNTNRISEEELIKTLKIMNEVSQLINGLIVLKEKRLNDIQEQTISMISHANKICEVVQKDLNELILMLLKN